MLIISIGQIKNGMISVCILVFDLHNAEWSISVSTNDTFDFGFLQIFNEYKICFYCINLNNKHSNYLSSGFPVIETILL